jgi:hypothetical protein
LPASGRLVPGFFRFKAIRGEPRESERSDERPEGTTSEAETQEPTTDQQREQWADSGDDEELLAEDEKRTTNSGTRSGSPAAGTRLLLGGRASPLAATRTLVLPPSASFAPPPPYRVGTGCSLDTYQLRPGRTPTTSRLVAGRRRFKDSPARNRGMVDEDVTGQTAACQDTVTTAGASRAPDRRVRVGGGD